MDLGIAGTSTVAGLGAGAAAGAGATLLTSPVGGVIAGTYFDVVANAATSNYLNAHYRASLVQSVTNGIHATINTGQQIYTDAQHIYDYSAQKLNQLLYQH